MKILYVSANPEFVKQPKEPTLNESPPGDDFKEYTKLDLWPELREITTALFDDRMSGHVRMEVVPEANSGDVIRYVEQFQPDIVLHDIRRGRGEILDQLFGAARLCSHMEQPHDHAPGRIACRHRRGRWHHAGRIRSRRNASQPVVRDSAAYLRRQRERGAAPGCAGRRWHLVA